MSSPGTSRAPSQYPKRRLFARSRKVSKPRDLYLELSDRSEIWQALRQHGCQCACQISKRYDSLKYQFRGFETLRDLTKRRLFGYWNGALFPLLQYIQLISNNTSRFDLNMLSSWPALESLSLHDNQISELPVIFPEDGNSTCAVDRNAICFLYFLGNPINCSVAVTEIIQQQDRIGTANLDCHIAISDLKYTYCKNPPYLCGRDLANLGKYSLLYL